MVSEMAASQQPGATTKADPKFWSNLQLTTYLLGLVLNATSIRRRIASGRPGVTGCFEAHTSTRHGPTAVPVPVRGRPRSGCPVYRELGRGHALRSERFLLDASAVLLRTALAEPFGFDALAISMDLPAAALVSRTPG